MLAEKPREIWGSVLGWSLERIGRKYLKDCMFEGNGATRQFEADYKYEQSCPCQSKSIYDSERTFQVEQKYLFDIVKDSE